MTDKTSYRIQIQEKFVCALELPEKPSKGDEIRFLVDRQFQRVRVIEVIFRPDYQLNCIILECEDLRYSNMSRN